MEINEIKTYRDLYLTKDDTSENTKAQAAAMPWFLGEEFVEALGIYEADISIGKPIRGLFVKKNRCPKCRSSEFNKNGFNSRGIARRKCKSCGKSYISDNRLATGDNSLNSRKKSEEWTNFIQLMLDNESMEKKQKAWMFEVAKECNLNIKTAYEWKNRTKKSLETIHRYVVDADVDNESDNQWYSGFLGKYRELFSDKSKKDEQEEFIRNTFMSLFIADSLNE